MIRDRLQKNYVVRATVTELGITTTEMFKFHIVQFLPLSLLGICFLSALFMFSYSVQWNKSSISRLSRRWQEKKNISDATASHLIRNQPEAFPIPIPQFYPVAIY